MHMKLYLSLAKIIWFYPYDTIQRVSRCRFTLQVCFQHLQSCNTLKSVLQFHSDTHTAWKHSLRLLICIETLMDTKIVNYPKRAHEERHGRLPGGFAYSRSQRNSRFAPPSAVSNDTYTFIPPGGAWRLNGADRYWAAFKSHDGFCLVRKYFLIICIIV